MITFKCKMCGGDLRPEENATTCECEYCGSVQTIPTADNEKKGNLFNRANRLRMAAEYDKAAAVYTSITAEFPEEAEAYWGLCLCKYGIEYVEDPITAKKIPTCHRTRSDSIMDDPDFDQACENADAIAKRVYREEAKAIDRLQRDILSVVANESPYDVFICYKETDDNGERAEDSVLAQDIYDALTAKGLKVFFARITLEDKLGQQYEPYIYAALHSAKVMLSIGTQYEYFDAVWVKNEWARFLDMMKADKSKTLIPCFKDIDAYDMPREFKNLQAQDMGKLGWLQDLTRGIMKLCGKDISINSTRNPDMATLVATNNEALIKRIRMFLREGSWKKADQYIERVLDADPENSEAYILRILTKFHCADDSALRKGLYDLSEDRDFAYAQEFADSQQGQLLNGIHNTLNKNIKRHALILLFSREIRRSKRVIQQIENYSASLTDQTCDGLIQLLEQLPDNADKQKAVLSCLKKAFEPGADVSLGYIQVLCNMLPEGEERSRLEARKPAMEQVEAMRAAFWKEQEKNAEKEKKERATYDRLLGEENSARKALDNNDREIERLKEEQIQAQAQLQNLRGLFIGKRRKELESIISELKTKLNAAILAREKLKKRYDEACAAVPEVPVHISADERELAYQSAKVYFNAGAYDLAVDEYNRIPRYKDVNKLLEADDSLAAVAYLAQFEVGNTVTFGHFMQDSNAGNSAKEIEWIVLANDGNTAMMISRYALDSKPYNTEYTSVTWETCTLRKWLNDDFLNMAFSAEEQARLRTVKVTADANPKYSTSPGNDTEDRVFLLSIPEVNQYFSDDSARVCMPTEYAVVQGAWTVDSGAYWWWLRSPGVDSDRAANVSTDGSVYYSGDSVRSLDSAVRPVVVLQLL